MIYLLYGVFYRFFSPFFMVFRILLHFYWFSTYLCVAEMKTKRYMPFVKILRMENQQHIFQLIHWTKIRWKQCIFLRILRYSLFNFSEIFDKYAPKTLDNNTTTRIYLPRNTDKWRSNSINHNRRWSRRPQTITVFNAPGRFTRRRLGTLHQRSCNNQFSLRTIQNPFQSTANNCFLPFFFHFSLQLWRIVPNGITKWALYTSYPPLSPLLS